MIIKKASENDIETIQLLANTIWPIAYKNIISAAQISYMLDLFYSTDALKKQIQTGHQFIISFENSAPIGFASFSSPSRNSNTVSRLHKIYVLPNTAIKGIGSLLLEYICNEAKNMGATSLELNVNKFNTAKYFYEKKGFVVINEQVIDIGNGFIMDDYVMSKNL
jgi:diamine N-acetyltransferase